VRHPERRFLTDSNFWRYKRELRLPPPYAPFRLRVIQLVRLIFPAQRVAINPQNFRGGTDCALVRSKNPFEKRFFEFPTASIEQNPPALPICPQVLPVALSRPHSPRLRIFVMGPAYSVQLVSTPDHDAIGFPYLHAVAAIPRRGTGWGCQAHLGHRIRFEVVAHKRFIEKGLGPARALFAAGQKREESAVSASSLQIISPLRSQIQMWVSAIRMPRVSA